MAANNPHGREVILELLRKFPNTPTLTLAKKAYKENKALWSSVEACRGHIRDYRGNRGKYVRSKTKSREHFRVNGKSGEMLFPRLPESLDGADGWKHYAVDTSGPWGIMGDLHIPYHNLAALRATLKEGKRRGWKGILINGDLFDMPGAFSKFDHDPRKSNFARDLYMGRQFLDTLKDAFPKARKIFKFGNHDLHYSRYLWGKCPELLDVEATWLENLIECEKYGVEIVKNNAAVLLGKLVAVHGHEWGNGGATSPVSPAKTIHDRLKESAICNHWHKPTAYSDPMPISQHIVTCWSVGCLCGLHPEYARINKWQHGAATAEIYRDGSYEVDNFRIINGEKWS